MRQLGMPYWLGCLPAVILQGNTYSANRAGNVDVKSFARGEGICYSPSEGCVSKLFRGQSEKPDPFKRPSSSASLHLCLFRWQEAAPRACNECLLPTVIKKRILSLFCFFCKDCCFSDQRSGVFKVFIEKALS